MGENLLQCCYSLSWILSDVDIEVSKWDKDAQSIQ